MLKGIDPMLNADVLHALRSMGHGDELILATFIAEPVARMQVVGDPDRLPMVQQQVGQAVDEAEGRQIPMAGIERHAFHARARQAYCVIQTAEPRGYGCFVFTKGVLLADENA